MKQLLDQFNRLNISAIKAENLIFQTENCLSYYGGQIKKMLNNPSLTWNNTYHVFQQALTGVHDFSTAINFLKSTGLIPAEHNNQYEESYSKTLTWLNKIYFNRKIALRFHKLKRVKKLTEEQTKLIDNLIACFSESFYSKKQQYKSQNIQIHLDKYENEFMNNLRLAKKNTFITFSNLNDFSELPFQMVQKAQNEAKKQNLKNCFSFNLEDDNYEKLLECCHSRSTRKYIYQTFVNLASNHQHNNNQTLKNLINWRSKLAKNNGHKNYTSYAVAGTGLEDPKKISAFLKNMKQHIAPAHQAFKKELQQFAKKEFGISKIFHWDERYLQIKLKEKLNREYDLNNIVFDYYDIQKHMFSLAKSLFGLTFSKASASEYNSWHPDIFTYKVFDEYKNLIGHLSFDILKRDEKPSGLIYQQNITSPIIFKNKIIPSQQAIVMHLKKDQNGNMEINIRDAMNLYHEFGHALHALISINDKYADPFHFIQADAIEFPSQLLERFLLNPQKIGAIATQYGKPIGAEKAKKLIHMYTLTYPHQYWVHVLHSQVDIHLNTRFKPNGSKSFHDSLAPIFMDYDFQLHKYNQFQNNQFEHFFMGSMYYSYLWSEHMVNCWIEQHGKKTQRQQGDLLKELFHKSLSNEFTSEFTKLVKDPYESELNFKF